MFQTTQERWLRRTGLKDLLWQNRQFLKTKVTHLALFYVKITTLNLEKSNVSDYIVKMTFILAICSETLQTVYTTGNSLISDSGILSLIKIEHEVKK